MENDKKIINEYKMAFTSDETVEILGINRKLLDAYRSKGLIKAIKTGRFWIYSKKEIEAFLDRYSGTEITKDGLVFEL